MVFNVKFDEYLEPGTYSIVLYELKKKLLQSNLYKTTTLETIQKWLFWTSGCLKNTFIKRPQTKSGCSWQIFRFYSHCECFINNKDLKFRVF